MKSNKILLTCFCFLFFGFCYAQMPPQEKQTIVFICEHGAARSVIASAYFNKLAKEQNLNYQAVFRGLMPDSTISIDTKTGLTKDGFVTNGWTTKEISNQDIEKAAQIITLDCNLERDVSLNKPMQKWGNIPTITGNYEAARDFIYAKVKEYVAELKNTQKRD